MSNIKPVTYNIFRYDDMIYIYFLSMEELTKSSKKIRMFKYKTQSKQFNRDFKNWDWKICNFPDDYWIS